MAAHQGGSEPRRWSGFGLEARRSGAPWRTGAARRSPSAQAACVVLLIAASVPGVAGISGLQQGIGRAASVIASALLVDGGPSIYTERQGAPPTVEAAFASGFAPELRGGNYAEFMAALPSDTMGPTTGPKMWTSGMVMPGLQDVEYAPFEVEEGPLAETMRMIQTQEHVMRTQASRCRAALQRLSMLQRFIAGRGGLETPLNAKEVQEEVSKWKVTTVEMQRQLGRCFNTVGRDFAELSRIKASRLEQLPDESSVTPSEGSEVEGEDAVGGGGPSVRRCLLPRPSSAPCHS
ncbi:hypothetical protein T484DRAFT_1789199 [Baffinella frigidus]|nr:hypothetical protein T484DRAFT_1789199 [Cryptophyta sp. CCMP2293]